MPETKNTQFYISQVNLPDGNTYLVKDSEARQLINSLAAKTAFAVSKDEATTPEGIQWQDGDKLVVGSAVASATEPIYLVPADYLQANAKDIYDEYISVRISENPDVFAWERLGDTEINFDNLGDFAYANLGKTSVDVPTSTTVHYTGTAQQYVSDAYTPSGNIKGGAFVGELMTSTGKVTPSGNIKIGTGSGEANYTPAGVNATSQVTNFTTTDTTVSLITDAGSTEAGKAAKWSHIADQFIAPTFKSGSYVAPTFRPTVENETLDLASCFNPGSHADDTFTAGSFTEGSFSWEANVPTKVTLPSSSSATVLTGVTGATAAGQQFTGTPVELTAIFTGNEADINVTGKTTGSVTPITFEGAEAHINTTVTPLAEITVDLNPETKTLTVSPAPKKQK